MQIAYAWRLIVRRWIVILIAGLLGLGIAAAGYFAMREYATPSYFVLNATAEESTLRIAEPQRFFASQTERVLSDPVLEDAAQMLGDGTTAQELRAAVSLSGGVESDILEVVVTGDSAQQSEDRAGAVVESIQGATLAGSDLELLWTGPTEPTLPMTRLLAGGLLGGLLLGALGVLLAGAVRRPVLDPHCLSLDTAADVYPKLIDSPDSPAQTAALAGWLSSGDQPGSPRPILIADAGRTRSTRTTTEGLRAAAAAHGVPVHTETNTAEITARITADTTAGRALVVLAQRGRTTEADIEDQLRMLGPFAERAAVAVVDAPGARRKRPAAETESTT